MQIKYSVFNTDREIFEFHSWVSTLLLSPKNPHIQKYIRRVEQLIHEANFQVMLASGTFLEVPTCGGKPNRYLLACLCKNKDRKVTFQGSLTPKTMTSIAVQRNSSNGHLKMCSTAVESFGALFFQTDLSLLPDDIRLRNDASSKLIRRIEENVRWEYE